jgi:hypothetical protein
VSISDTDTFVSCDPGGAFPEIAADIVLSSDDDDVARPPEPDAPTMPKRCNTLIFRRI